MLNKLKEFAKHLNEHTKAELYLVGGSVRDMIMDIEPKDYDLELFNVWPSEFVKYLDKHEIPFKFNSDAKFPVYRTLIGGEYHEIGFPRVDNKIGPKHSDYECVVNPFMKPIDATMRRDFCINGVYYNLLTDEYHNKGFISDIKDKYLSPIHYIKFKEDSLRIMRGFQFISRFDLSYSDTISAIDNSMMEQLFNVDPSGIYAEFCKGITKATNITKALDYLWWLSTFDCKFFNLIGLMKLCQQNTQHHFEGNVWEHTKLVIKNAIELAYDSNDYEKVLLFFAAFFHDVGKIETFKLDEDGLPTAHGHDREGDELVRLYAGRFGLPLKMIDQVIMLKRCHMISCDAKNKKLYKMAEDLYSVGLSFNILFKLMLADCYGSVKQYFKSTTRSHAEAYKFIEKVKKLGVEDKPLKMLVNGHHITTLSQNKLHGKEIGGLLDEAKQLQFAGRINNEKEGVEFLKKRIKNILDKKSTEC